MSASSLVLTPDDISSDFTVPTFSLRIGGLSVQAFGYPADKMFPDTSALSAFQVPAKYPDVSVFIEPVPELAARDNSPLFDSGDSWKLFEHESDFCFDFFAADLEGRPHKRLLIDSRFSNARLQISERITASRRHLRYPFTYPLDELLIMHRLTQERAIELHGTGIVRANGVANLFVGHSGAGKSTTTRLWTSREAVEVLSDDRIIVRHDDGRDGPIGQTGMRMYGTPWHGEAMFASPDSAPLTRIFILEHGHGNEIKRLSAGEAIGELFARAFVPFHRHEYIENALSFLEQLASSVPCYRYSFEPDERAVGKIQKFHD
jgi:hypothetical protein